MALIFPLLDYDWMPLWYPKMCMFIVPKNFGIAGNIGILALNCIIGGVIGGGIIIIKITSIFIEILNFVRCKNSPFML